MTDAHKAIVRRAFQTNPLLGSPTAAKDRDLYANDFVFTGPSTELASIDAFRHPGRVKDLLGESDRVVVRWEASGTQTADFMSISPSGRRATVAGITILTCDAGRIQKAWGNINWIG